MTEAEWLDEFENPRRMIEQLCRMGKARGKRGQRKMRLFASVCCRHYIASDLSERDRGVTDLCQQVAELCELFADGEVGTAELAVAQQEVSQATAEHIRPEGVLLYWVWRQENEALRAAQAMVGPDAIASANRVIELRNYRSRGYDPAHVLRDIFGNPFRSVSVDPGLLTWEDGAVVRLAQGIYNERAFDDLPILADALEEAGCTDPLLFDHLDDSGPHSRGCWVLDFLLGRE